MAAGSPRLPWPFPGPFGIGQDEEVENDRLVPLEGSFNFRDLGGYRTASGRVIRERTLFRSDALHDLTATDVALLADLGLRTVIDLRTERELLRTGRGPLEQEDVAFFHLPVIQEGGTGESVGAPEETGDDLALRYLWYLEVGGDGLVQALRLLAREGSYPLVFHCAAVKDRTGILAALVMEILGIARDEIVADYLITESRMEHIMARFRTERYAQAMAAIPAVRFSVRAASIEGFLDGLAERYGGARQWALHAGLGSDDLDAISGTLLA